jgi:hypothetical protein
MSASATQSVIRKQLCAMGCALYEIGVLNEDGRMLLRSGWSVEQFDAALGWLRRANAHGAQIFVRPHGAHALSLVDDLSAEAVLRMGDDGFQPAVVVETSPRNYQVWLNHGRILFDRTLSTQAAKELARRYTGDPSSADWRHFGRLAGFTNQKPIRRLDNGFAPFVRLHEWRGHVYNKADEFLEQVSGELAIAAAERATLWLTRKLLSSASIRPIAKFHENPRYRGDLHRADMAWALHAASRGLSRDEIRREIFHARDLSKKGGRRRQSQYAERTAAKAIASAPSDLELVNVDHAPKVPPTHPIVT